MMNPPRKPIVIATEAVRAGSEERVVRYVLGISLPLTVLALSLTWISAAVSVA
ncbi:MAG: hypothetical protein H6917_02170 [Novosphingobium sp.]|nr:hypothetical protein [Novosphingobium sp.]MCP5401177.1 hypothetical protein [Novosphingobium sp.]